MNFTETDINIEIEGMGIVLYSPKTVENIPKGINFLMKEFNKPNHVANHLKKGDVVGFCTGSGGRYLLKFREGYPPLNMDEEYPVAIRLGIDVQDNEIHIIDLFWLMQWNTDCPKEQILSINPGFYHITLLTKRPESGIWGDNQIIYVYLNKLPQMPQLKWNGVPLLFTE